MSDLWNLYQAVGNETFGAKISEIAPYFRTIFPQFKSLKPGYCEIILPNRREVHNHLGTVHAIAMCNAAELVAGLMTDVSIPDGSRWIPTGMTVKYLAKAKTDLKVIAEGKNLPWNQPGNIEVPVSIFDDKGVEVFSAKITMNVRNS